MATIGAQRHVVTFQTLTSVADGDGGYVDTWVPLDPPWPCEIIPATVHNLERRTAGTVVASTTHVVSGRYRADVKVDGRMLFGARVFTITGVKNIDERSIDMELFVSETL